MRTPPEQPAEAPKAAVIIIHFGDAALTKAAVESVLAQTISERLKVVVVDNGSTDDASRRLRGWFGDRVTLVRSEENRGFAGGNNLGLRYAEGRYVLLLNNDAEARPEWAERLIAAAEADSTVGMCTPKILAWADRKRIDCTGHNMYPDGLSRSRGNWQRDDGRYDTQEETLVASGCAGLYLREAVMEWGGFDEDFFAYQDDIELGLKLRLSGYRCLYVPEAVVYHHGSAGEGLHDRTKVFLIERNRVWTLLLFFPLTRILASPLHTTLRLWGSYRSGRRGIGQAGEVARRSPLWRVGATILHAWFAALIALPAIVRKRWRIRARRKIGAREFRDLLSRFRATVDEMGFGGREPCP